MELIQNNPYRIVGILSNASARELQKQKAKIQAYAKVGKEIKSDYDFQMLGDIARTEEVIDKAFSNIEQNQDKIKFALFWFLNVSELDNTALEYLKTGNAEKAMEIWGKVVQNKEVNSVNFSAFNNLGTYKLLSQSQNDLKEGLEVKTKLIESEYFRNFVHSVADETATVDKEKQIKILINQVLTQFKGQYSNSEMIALFSNCNGSSLKYLTQKFTEEPFHKIESQIEKTKKKRKENKAGAYDFGIKLFENCKDDLAHLKSLLGTNDLNYKMIADQLANEIMQCGFDYFNESQENDSTESYLEASQELTELADSIAVGKLTKDRVKDSLATLSEMKDKDLLGAIHLLKNVKSAYEANSEKILAEVKSMRLGYNQTVNWTSVTNMIEKSINWDKVVELITQVVSEESVEKIKNSSQLEKVNEYKSLVDFLLSKLNYHQTNQVKYLCYWKKVTNNVVFREKDKRCYIATMAYGDYDHPQVMELRKFRDEFLRKYIVGRKLIKLYYRYSPSLVEKLKNKQKIALIIRSGLDQFIKVIKK